ncbi:hypothetical protein H6G96_26290 [Nostoc sp. FACHB-892]|uniref:hypothetical protein n=1 Tax=Nostoc sp. FACHB-892 TaxID=2692843 RepID=UPI0016898DE4|nr:hypothetical protein [Nostoc sp. FACHB-892]MBD2729730.1 hypothetical protein [Nostoc sp. FACHB-892]
MKRGRPRKRFKVLAADKGYDSKQQRASQRIRSIRPQIPKRVWKIKKNTRVTYQNFCAEISLLSVVSHGINVNTAVLSEYGNVKKFTLTHSLTLLQSTSGLTKYYYPDFSPHLE